MIIDADVHISPYYDQNISISMEELICRMDRSKVDKAVTWLQPPYKREIDESNLYIYNACTKYPDRILGFGWADPNLGVYKAKEMVKKCIFEYGFYGVKMNGAQNSYYIDDPQISIPVIEEIAKTGKILAFHVGADAYEFTHPFRVAKIAEMFPELQILMVHMGGVGVPDLSNSAIEIALIHKNITLIGSMVRDLAILKAIKVLGASRICFGSDTPFALMHVETAKYQALLDEEVNKDDKKLIMGGNIERLFKL